MHVKRRKMATF